MTRRVVNILPICVLVPWVVASIVSCFAAKPGIAVKARIAVIARLLFSAFIFTFPSPLADRLGGGRPVYVFCRNSMKANLSRRLAKPVAWLVLFEVLAPRP